MSAPPTTGIANVHRHASVNRIFRLVWSHASNSWVPAAETTRSRGKGACKTLLATTLALCAGLTEAGPIGGQVVTGSGHIAQSAALTTITQTSPVLSLSWASFNIAPQETVNFAQPSASAIAVNRIAGSNGTQILGHLNANGQVYLINPNGIVFGRGAQVNVGGLVASTLDVDDTSLLADTRSFRGAGSGSVENHGAINATGTGAGGGYVALLGNHVSNQGTISARLGTVALGAGSAATLSFQGDSLVHLQVDRSVLNSVTANGGLIRADGGQVLLSAGAKDALLASVVNNNGVIEAKTVEEHAGTITLLGGMAAGTVNVAGTLDASAPDSGNGGFIETSAAHVEVASSTKITTAAAHGLTGSWMIDPHDFTVAATGGDITGATLSGNLATTDATLQSSGGTTAGSGNLNINDPVSWSTNHKLTLIASNNVNVNANITASGNTAGLVISPNTANGGETASGPGAFKLGSGTTINLTGSAPSLSIAGANYVVINSLGSAGSTTGTDLQGANGNLAARYALGSNIAASPTATWNSGAGFMPIGTLATPFTGTFDGLGHTISNLSINRTSIYYVGLFGEVGSAGIVRNTGMPSGNVHGGGYYDGILAGRNLGSISNSYTTGSLSGTSNSIGGLVGGNDATGTVSNTYSTATISGANNTGGLIGLNYGSISNSYAAGTVNGGYDVGGLIGFNRSGTATNVYSTGAVNGIANIGGLAGQNNATVSNSYATGNAHGSGATIGGLVGNNYGTVSNSYATGTVTGSSRLAGLAYGGTVNNSFWNITTSGLATSTRGTGLTTAGMMTTSNFSGAAWSIANAGGSNAVWRIYDGYTAPLLSSFLTPLTVTAANASTVFNGVDFSGNGVIYSATPNGNLLGTLTYGAAQGAIHAGSYAITPAGQYSNQKGYSIAAVGATLTIAALPLTGTVTAGSSVYGAPLNPGVVTFTNLVSGHTAVASPITITTAGNLSSSGHLNAGSYNGIESAGSTLSGNDAGDYTFAGATGAYTVSKLALMGSLAPGTSVYGAPLSAGAVTFTNAIGSDVVTAAATVSTTNHTSSSGNFTAGTHAGSESVGSTLTGADAGNYTFAGASGDYTVTPLALNGSIATGNSVYGSALTPGAVSFSNAIGGDTVIAGTAAVTTTNHTSTSGNFTAGTHVGSESVGSMLTGADAGNYTFAGASGDYTVTPLALNGSIVTGSSVYGSALTPGAVSVSNVIGGDSITAGTAAVDTTNHVSTSGNFTAGTHAGSESVGGTLTGADAGNYTFAGASGDYTVTPLALNGSIATGSSVYGSGLTPGAVSFSNASVGDIVTAGTATVSTATHTSTSGHFTAGTHAGSESVGSTLNGADAGNYTFAGASGDYTVTPLTLSVAVTGVNKVYDGTASAEPMLSAGGVILGDKVNLAAGTASYAGKNVANAQPINVSGITIKGADAVDYALNSTSAIATGTIFPASLTVSGVVAADKVYDGTTAAILAGGSLVGVVPGDAGGLALNDAGRFAFPNAGTGIAVAAAETLDGASAGNYVLVQPHGLLANITPATLTYHAAPASRTAGQSPTGLSGSLSGFVAGETQANDTAGALAWTTPANAASRDGQYAIDGSGLTAANYVFVEAPGNASALTLLPAEVEPPASPVKTAATLPPAALNVISALQATLLVPASMGSTDDGFNAVSWNERQGAHSKRMIGTTNISLSIVSGGVRLPR